MENEKNFRKWFGNSIVKTADGQPKIVYHGSGSQFDAFDLSKIGDKHGRSEGSGFYFTDDKTIADGYSNRDDGGHLYEVYLRIEKPIKYSQKSFTKSQLVKLVKRVAEIESAEDGIDINDGFLSNYGYIPDEGFNRVVASAVDGLMSDDTAIEQLGGMVGSGLSPTQVNQAVYESLGYDGYVSDGFGNMGVAGGTIYVAMFPWQIKSINNKGSWSKNSDNIMESTFNIFLEKLNVGDNNHLIESVKRGYNLLFENDNVL